jgi:hypothetical protein
VNAREAIAGAGAISVANSCLDLEDN